MIKKMNNLEKQIYKSGRYFDLHILVPFDEDEFLPYCTAISKNGNPIMMAKAVAYAENLINAIYKQEPIVRELKERYGQNRDEVYFDNKGNRKIERIREDEE